MIYKHGTLEKSFKLSRHFPKAKTFCSLILHCQQCPRCNGEKIVRFNILARVNESSGNSAAAVHLFHLILNMLSSLQHIWSLLGLRTRSGLAKIQSPYFFFASTFDSIFCVTFSSPLLHLSIQFFSIDCFADQVDTFGTQ